MTKAKKAKVNRSRGRSAKGRSFWRTKGSPVSSPLLASGGAGEKQVRAKARKEKVLPARAQRAAPSLLPGSPAPVNLPSSSSSSSRPLDLAALKAPGTLELLDPAKIELNPHNPRVAPADAEAQAAFERSVAEQGVLEPVLVRPNEPAAVKAGRAPYQLVAGERRLKAALKAVRAKALPAAYRIPAVVKPLDNRQALIVALTENLARADMHPLDEAEAFAKLAARIMPR